LLERRHARDGPAHPVHAGRAGVHPAGADLAAGAAIEHVAGEVDLAAVVRVHVAVGERHDAAADAAHARGAAPDAVGNHRARLAAAAAVGGGGVDAHLAAGGVVLVAVVVAGVALRDGAALVAPGAAVGHRAHGAAALAIHRVGIDVHLAAGLDELVAIGE